jgi:ribosome biogenesis protein NSA2
MSSEYYPAYCASKLFSANFENSMERWRKLHGRRVRLIWTSGIQVDRLTNTASLTTRREARKGHKESDKSQSLVGLRAKLYHQKRHHEKIQIKKQIKAHEERNVKSSTPIEPSKTPLPQYLLDRSNPTNAKALSSASTSIPCYT